MALSDHEAYGRFLETHYGSELPTVANLAAVVASLAAAVEALPVPAEPEPDPVTPEQLSSATVGLSSSDLEAELARRQALIDEGSSRSPEEEAQAVADLQASSATAGFADVQANPPTITQTSDIAAVFS